MKLPFFKAAPKRSAGVAPKQDILYLNNGSAVGVVKWSDSIAAQAAMSHPIVYRALDKLASSVQQVKWRVQPVVGSDKRVLVAAAKKIQDLLDYPNNEMTPGMLRYWMALNYASYGRVTFKVGHSTRKTPNAIYPLQVDKVRAVVNDRGAVDYYTYGSGPAAQRIVSRTAWRSGQGSDGFADQIWKPAYRGHQGETAPNSPLRSIGLPAEVIKALLLRALQTANGQPNVRYMVTCSRTLTSKQMQAIADHLNRDHGPMGPEGGKVPILQNAADVEIHKLDNDLSDIHSKMPSDDMARLIFGAFGIPIALAGMGAADAAKFTGNFDASRLSFWEDAVIPMYVEPLFQGLTRAICPPGLEIVPDYNSIPALAAGRVAAMKEINGVSFLTTNEKRERFGYDPTSELPTTFAFQAQETNNGSGL